MASYSSREIISRRIEYTVPAPWPQGAAHAELLKALAAAAGRLRAERGISENIALSDDALWVRSGDDEVIISFTVETAADSAATPPDDRCLYCGHPRSRHDMGDRTHCCFATQDARCGCTAFVEPTHD
jgi:hypothetical protein